MIHLCNLRVFKSVKFLSEPWLINPEENVEIDHEAAMLGVDKDDAEVSMPLSEKGVASAPVVPPPDFEIERKKVIGQAQTEAKKMVETAQNKAKDIEKNAYEKGVIAGKQQGISEGQELGRQEVGEIVETLNRVITSVESYKQELVNEAEEKVVRLALEIAKKVISQEVKQDKSIVVKLIEDCIKRITERERLILRVSKEDIEILMENRDVLLACADGIKSIEFQEDGRVESGGCIIETPVGTVDVRVASKLGAISKAFDTVLKDEMETKSD